MGIGGWQVVLSGVQDAGLASAGVRGFCQSCMTEQSNKERRGTWGSSFVHLKNIYLKIYLLFLMCWWKSEDNYFESGLSFHLYLCSRDGTQLV